VALVYRDGAFHTDTTRIGKEPATRPGEFLWLFVTVP
jgi:hypothetical protein